MTEIKSYVDPRGGQRVMESECSDCGSITRVKVPAHPNFNCFKYGRCAECVALEFNSRTRLEHARRALYGNAQEGQPHA